MIEKAESVKESSIDCHQEYQIPTVKVITVVVEKGFAASLDPEGTGKDMPWG